MRVLSVHQNILIEDLKQNNINIEKVDGIKGRHFYAC